MAGRPKGGHLLSIHSKAITPEQVQEVLLACANLTADTRVNSRWSAYLQLLWETGVRPSEAIAIAPEDIGETYLTVKRLKRRRSLQDLVPIRPVLRDLLKSLPVLPGGRLFPGYDAASYIWRSIREKVGLPEHITLHSFRHGFALNFLRQAPPEARPTEVLIYLQAALGHTSVGSTSVYIQADREEKDRLVRQMKF